jgi:hypothetical protein
VWIVQTMYLCQCLVNFHMLSCTNSFLGIQQTNIATWSIQYWHWIKEALNNRKWVFDIKGALTVQVTWIFNHLSLVDDMVLDPAISDQHSWCLSKTGSYSSKSAYEAFFIGTIRFAPWKRIWKSCAPLKCKFFIWLALNCWNLLLDWANSHRVVAV